MQVAIVRNPLICNSALPWYARGIGAVVLPLEQEACWAHSHVRLQAVWGNHSGLFAQNGTIPYQLTGVHACPGPTDALMDATPSHQSAVRREFQFYSLARHPTPKRT